MQTRINYPSGAVWEDIVGYSRAVRIGNQLEISGTTAIQNGQVVGKGDLFAQTDFILSHIETIIVEAGGTLNDVIRTRMFVTDISRWEEAARAHSAYFGDIKPATSMVEVQKLIDPALLIEIEATAILRDAD